MANMIGRLAIGDIALQEVSGRDGGTVADTTALGAMTAAQRQHGMHVTVWNSGDPEIYYFDESAEDGDVAPSAGDGYWIRYTADTVEDGSVTAAKLVMNIRNESGGGLVAGDLVYISGWSEAESRFLVSKADADLVGALATFIAVGTIANNANGAVRKTYRLTAVDTAAAAVGDPVYLSATAGGWTLTSPTIARAIPQIVGRVAVVNASTGEIEFDIDANPVKLPRVVGPLVVAGQNESTPAITVTGIRTGDELMSFIVMAAGIPTARALTDFSVSDDTITVGANAANNAANKYLVTYAKRT